ncbi:helix-turn-helix domain-containing protein [Niallia taxi]|uniref:helix-turn-helix domain-containing protein n=1 Tax=Niallia taxi TaxID=2499688 RepID=UPI0015F424CC|nr:helix-turn-helix transcriptional regulator [Niallia taxi]
MENDLGRFLEGLRGKLSLRDAANKSGLSHTYIRDLELGINRKTKAPIRPSADTLKQLAQAYDYPVNGLLKKAGYIEDVQVNKEMTEERFDPEVRSLARDIKNLQSSDKELLKGLIKSMQQKGKKALDE